MGLGYLVGVDPVLRNHCDDGVSYMFVHEHSGSASISSDIKSKSQEGGGCVSCV